MTLHSQMIQLPNSYLLHLKSLSKISPSYKQKCTNMEDSWGGEVRSKIQQQGNKVVQVYWKCGAPVWRVLGNAQLKHIYQSSQLVSALQVSNQNFEFIIYLFLHTC
jgi:hypothetical protein